MIQLIHKAASSESMKLTSWAEMTCYDTMCSKADALKEQWKGKRKANPLRQKKENIFNPFMKNLFLNNISYTFSQ